MVAQHYDSQPSRERDRQTVGGGGYKVSLAKFHITSTHSMINVAHELAKKCTDSLFQLKPVRERDNHEVM